MLIENLKRIDTINGNSVFKIDAQFVTDVYCDDFITIFNFQVSTQILTIFGDFEYITVKYK